jgi:hypothetical protein
VFVNEAEREEGKKKYVLYPISESGNVVVNKRSGIPYCEKGRRPDKQHTLFFYLLLFQSCFPANFIRSVMQGQITPICTVVTSPVFCRDFSQVYRLT